MPRRHGNRARSRSLTHIAPDPIVGVRAEDGVLISYPYSSTWTSSSRPFGPRRRPHKLGAPGHDGGAGFLPLEAGGGGLVLRRLSGPAPPARTTVTAAASCRPIGLGGGADEFTRARSRPPARALSGF
jgi:hypothetical protein